MQRWDSLDDLMADAEQQLDRIEPSGLAEAMDRGALVVDIRDSASRAAEGELPGAVVFDLTILEWRLAPSSDSREVDLTEDDVVILVCNEGYSSVLAALRLRSIGLPKATDLAGGFRAWTAWKNGTESPDGRTHVARPAPVHRTR